MDIGKELRVIDVDEPATEPLEIEHVEEPEGAPAEAQQRRV